MQKRLREPARSVFSFRFIVLALLFCLFITLACERKPPPDVTDPGQLLYLGFLKKDVDCSRCHGPEGQGGWKGPDIRGVFAKKDSMRIVTIIKEGKGKEDDMPAFAGKLTDGEIRQLLTFLKTMIPER